MAIRVRGYSVVLLLCILLSTIAAAAAPPAEGQRRPAAGCAVAAPPGLINAGTLALGNAFNAPPVDFLQDGQPAGFDVDLADALASQMCLHAQWTSLAFAGLFPALDARKFDAVMSSVGITEQREKVYSFVPYFLGGLRMVVRKGSNLYFENESQVCGHSVGTSAGSTEARDLTTYNATCPGDKKMDIRIYPSFNEAIEQLRKQSVQVIFIDWPLATYSVKANPNEFAIGSPVLSGEAPGKPRHRDGIMIRKDDVVLQSALEKALANVEANGTYERLLAKWGLQDGDIRKAR